MMSEREEYEIRDFVRARYGDLAKASRSGCCDPGPSESSCCGPETSGAKADVNRHYETADVHHLPLEVTGLSLGCGDPVTLAGLEAGQRVLDLGSGGGIDCFLAGERVGPEGFVIGVDMTPEMVERAGKNKEKVGADNVDFRLGEIEHLPVPDGEVDVVISNCVINLSPDKPGVFREAFRVLKPGGLLAVTDMVTAGPLPDEIKRDLSAWAGCVAGAWELENYVAAIEAAGFTEVEVRADYMPADMIRDAADQIERGDWVAEVSDDELRRTIFSAEVRARKPVGGS